MKIVFLLLGFILCTQAMATQCNQSQLKADYAITMYQTEKHQSKKLNTQQLILWRNNQQVAHQGKLMTELWFHLANNSIRPIRYFNAEKRGIEYQPSEVKGIQHWSAKNQLIDNNFIKKMDLISTEGSSCETLEKYNYKQGGKEYFLSFYPEKHLVKSLKVTEKGHTEMLLSLNQVSYNTEQVEAQFAQWNSFNTTDYADIGDHENDPFLSKMINLGFIEHGAMGFYNQNGEAIQSSHHHH